MSKIQQYYDDTAEYYDSVGINDRNYKIHSLLRHFGLKKEAKVLEIGCGVGVQTSLLFKKVAHIVALDLSERSIILAKEKYQRVRDVEWKAADIFEIEITTQFDIILLADVLHYIPEEKYGNLFEKMAKNLAQNGYIFIHSPTAAFVEWCRKNDNSKLNLDDIAIDNQQVAAACQSNNLTIVHYQQYSLWHQSPDYQYWVIQHYNPMSFDASKLSFWKRLKKKIFSIF